MYADEWDSCSDVYMYTVGSTFRELDWDKQGLLDSKKVHMN